MPYHLSSFSIKFVERLAVTDPKSALPILAGRFDLIVT
jgi:hypothetical protein